MHTTASITLAINAGSSSVKSALFTFEREPQLVARTSIEATGASAAPRLLEWVESTAGGMTLAAVGHRVVHGGPRHHEPQRITTAVRRELAAMTAFAPNHLPDEMALVDAFAHRDAAIVQVACFDTAFHHTMPDVARRLPIPAAYDARGVRRYGFHGLSYAFLLEELGRVAGAAAARSRVVLAHLGNGSSLAAVHEGCSIDTTMAFTPIGGVVMSTRSGDLDPGVVTYIARADGLTPDQVEDVLSKASGLAGVSGGSSDMKTLVAREASDPASRLAVDMYVYGVRKAIGALAAALGGIDVLVFSGGIGEHAATVRARIADGLAFLGIEIDARQNAANAPLVSAPDARVQVRVIATDEELMIARAVYRVLASS
jgi:acetate kinase